MYKNQDEFTDGLGQDQAPPTLFDLTPFTVNEKPSGKRQKPVFDPTWYEIAHPKWVDLARKAES